jgi:hypothetical protein
MIRSISLIALAISSISAAQVDPWINEFHYRPKENMFVEIAGPAHQSADGLHLMFYQGRNGSHYPPMLNMTGQTFSQGVDAASGIGFLIVDLPHIHKGNQEGDGFALTNDALECLQFISYGGSFTALSGTCNGVTSDDVGIEEPPHNPDTTSSIQLHGTGSSLKDFTWWDQLQTATPGAVNVGQHLTPGTATRRLRYVSCDTCCNRTCM